MQSHWKLAQTLERFGQTPMALAQASGLTKTTVYALVNDKSKAVELETLDKVIAGLEQLTGQPMSYQDVLERRGQSLSPALLHQLRNAKPIDLETLEKLIPQWTPEEQVENERFFQALEEMREQDRVDSLEQNRELMALFPPDPEGEPQDPA